ncbi:MAG: hypothetical protein E7388_06085 [Ruminococcaceae bacterium]|nr:hypothetical protein [Oscillospiraceae bacterium]
MKLFRYTNIILVLLIALNAFVLVGCKNGSFGEDLGTSVEPTPVTTLPPNRHPADFVKFYKSTEPRELYVPIEEIMDYESKYPDCNGTWYRNQLSGEDLLIYNSYLYAMENQYIHFTVFVEDNTKDFKYIREYLSLDSPFLEQNYNDYGEWITKEPVSHHGKSMYFAMDQFTMSRWKMKMEALEKCREVVAGIPGECKTLLKKMEYLYDYVCDHVEYVKYESMADESYFYDAVINGKTVCDGYSNMLNLLFNLIGVECCEAMGSDIEDISQATPEEIENSNGHTWVVAKVDGEFYNFDVTFDDSGDGTKKTKKYFGISDQIVGVKYIDYEEIRPKCTNTSRDYNYADLVVSTKSGTEEKIANSIKKHFSDNNTEFYLVINEIISTSEANKYIDSVFANIYLKKDVMATWVCDKKSTIFCFSTD